MGALGKNDLYLQHVSVADGLLRGSHVVRLPVAEGFLALVANRFGGRGLYILDEPEAALSPMRVMTLMAHMARLVDDESQFVISTHSPMLMAFPGADVLQVAEAGIERVDYRDTEHYQVTRRFLEAPERMLGYLFDD